MEDPAKKKLLSNTLLLVAGLLVLWAMGSALIARQEAQSPDANEKYHRALGDELPDTCRAPEGYTDREWREHMRLHPGQYPECLGDETPGKGAYLDISADELAVMLADTNSDVTLVDVHTPEQAHIPGTDAFIPYETIADRKDALPENLETPIVVYCRSGSMSTTAAETLISLGYRNVYNLEGGTNAWKANGGEVITDAR